MPSSPTLDPGHVRRLADSFRLSLEASNKSPRTIKAYMEAVGLLATFLEHQGMPTSISANTREHVEHFLVEELKRTRPTSASIRYRALQQFFKRAEAESEIPSSPMARPSIGTSVFGRSIGSPISPICGWDRPDR